MLLVKERRGWCNNGHIVHCNKQTGRPVDSSVTVYECKGLQARQPGQNKMLHRTIFVLMVKMTILLLYTVYSICFLTVLVLCPQQPLIRKSDLKYLHHKDKMTLRSHFHSIVRERWMTERLGWGRLKSKLCGPQSRSTDKQTQARCLGRKKSSSADG